MVVARALGNWKMGSCCLIDSIEFQFCMVKKFWRLVANNEGTELYTLKWLGWLLLCVFYIVNFLIWKIKKEERRVREKERNGKCLSP